MKHDLWFSGVRTGDAPGASPLAGGRRGWLSCFSYPVRGADMIQVMVESDAEGFTGKRRLWVPMERQFVSSGSTARKRKLSYLGGRQQGIAVCEVTVEPGHGSVERMSSGGSLDAWVKATVTKLVKACGQGDGRVVWRYNIPRASLRCATGGFSCV